MAIFMQPSAQSTLSKWTTAMSGRRSATPMKSARFSQSYFDPCGASSWAAVPKGLPCRRRRLQRAWR